MFDLKSYLSSKQAAVNHWIETFLTHETHPKQITTAMQYSLSAGGKRVRPVLCIAAAEAVDGEQAEVLHVACAIEMIHTYSLIHDDLPAMDDDIMRRGNPTAHIQFGEATAILAGDALLTLAFQILSDARHINIENLDKSMDAIHVIAKAAGYRGMIEGQMLDILSEGNRLKIDEIKALHKKKTGALIEASVSAGALFGGASTKEMDDLNRYAAHIGLAFQVMDDILNVRGDPLKMGKAVGTDVGRNKNTYPSIIGLPESEKYAVELVEKSLHAIETFGRKADPLRAISRYIIERKT